MTDTSETHVPPEVVEMAQVFRDLETRVTQATGLGTVSEYGPVIMHDGKTWRLSAVWFVPSPSGDLLDNHGFSLEWDSHPTMRPYVGIVLARFETFGPDAWRDSTRRIVQHWPDLLELAWERMHPALKARPPVASVSVPLLEAS